MRLIKKIDVNKVQAYMLMRRDIPIYQIYNEIKNKKFKDRTDEECVVFAYLSMNKRKLGLK